MTQRPVTAVFRDFIDLITNVLNFAQTVFTKMINYKNVYLAKPLVKPVWIR